MIRTLALAVAAGLAAAPLHAAEGGPILSGEHANFSRLVVRIDPTTEWSLETAEGRVTLFIPGREIAFDAARIFEKIPRTRIGAVATAIGPRGTTVAVELTCDCRVSTLFVKGRHLALDVSDRDAVLPAPESQPVAETAEARDLREAAAVDAAEQILLRQIERAAGQGLIELADAGPPAPPQAGPETGAGTATETVPVPAGVPPALPDPTPPARPESDAAPTLPVALTARGAPEAAGIAALLDLEQIEATTVFDRERAKALAEMAEPEVAVECLPDEAMDIARWSDGRPAFEQIVDLSSHLLGEFDAPDPETLARLIRIDIRFGLGTEAEAVLASFPQDFENRALLLDLARAVEGRALPPEGPLSAAVSCPGAHGLWSAIASNGPALPDDAGFETIHAAFAELPPDLRGLVGPGLVARLLDAGRTEAARLIQDTTTRPETAQTSALTIVGARLAAAEGDPQAGIHALSALIEADAAAAPEALLHLARLAADAGLPLPDRHVTDLRAAALQARGAARAAELRLLLAESLAVRGELPDAIAEIRSALIDLPRDPRFAELAVALLAAADPERVGRAAYAETVLASTTLVSADPANDPARRAIARRLLDLGLPQGARAMVEPAAARAGEAARLLLAESWLRSRESARARDILAGIEGPEAARLTAEALALDGDFAEAGAVLREAGLPDAADAYAWSSGDWPRARDEAAPDPGRQAMAEFMVAQTAPEEARPASPDPSALDAEEAFVEPLPALERPSLDAARRLLATGRQVEDFVQALLAKTPPGGAPAAN
ncbi:MAG TPA: hypothetical protein PKA33_12775 [Amaricoccus sp.]|uniref:hypothetical protein n=1 Tax=Amaricoccus sp. TaxID=1872485 RepID=UPI002C884A0E|nr:hypothetical protein [Amaricoccus sp.]HMQ93854.1 hypothetical protein [Amaricoccus sp.]HMR53311.1 hypothetical protein [Amaricoccus sp.]HMR60329.1 hypothetical protein [Amaricoccus sp.]HMU00226.1 hypothetical protein [Amaricoccus sp.]